MTKPLMNFEEVRAVLKQRFPMLMVDTVVELEVDKRILATKNVTGNEIHFLGHFPDQAIMPGVLIIETVAQVASILFSKSSALELKAGEFLVLGVVSDMRFLVPVLPGDRLHVEVKVVKFAGDIALVEGVVTVDGTVVSKGKLGFAKKALSTTPSPPSQPA